MSGVPVRTDVHQGGRRLSSVDQLKIKKQLRISYITGYFVPAACVVPQKTNGRINLDTSNHPIVSKKSFCLTIRTKPYLKKYLLTLYGETQATCTENPPTGKLAFSIDNLFGVIVAAFLYRPLDFRKNAALLKNRADRFDTPLDVELPMTVYTKGHGPGYAIDDDRIITLNKLFENKFEEDLWQFVLIRNIGDVETKDALLEFAARYNIEIDEDITYECLKKKEWRYRQKMKKTSPQLSTGFVTKNKEYRETFTRNCP